jgi:DNA-directed RNA polymerase beta subunit
LITELPQAYRLEKGEPATGHESTPPHHRATAKAMDGERIASASDVHVLQVRGLNERTCQNQKPIVRLGQKVEKGDVIADGAATHQGELALGRNVLAAFMAWDGFNFEDAIIISEELVKSDTYTSIHIEEFDIEIRETKLGREEFTRDIPNVSEKALRSLDETGIVRVGTYVRPGDILSQGRQSQRAHAGREAVARDLRPGRRRRQERLAGGALRRGRHRHRHAEVFSPHEPLRRRAQGLRGRAEGG